MFLSKSAAEDLQDLLLRSLPCTGGPFATPNKSQTSLLNTWPALQRSWNVRSATSPSFPLMNTSYNSISSRSIPRTPLSEFKMTVSRSLQPCHHGLPQSILRTWTSTHLPPTKTKTRSCVPSPTAANWFFSPTSTTISTTTPQRHYHLTRLPESIILISQPT